MLFSVLIANYNNAPYLEEALSSIFSQTYTDWEIIIVDDSSTDGSKEILESYGANDKVHIYYNNENKGCGFTKRRCVEKANGEVCGFLDPDDVLHKDALKIMVEQHEAYSNAGLIYSTYCICDETLKPLRIPKEIGNFEKGETQLTNTKISHFATFKKKDYLKTEGINPSFPRAVDQDLYFKLEEVTDTKFVDKLLYYYRKHEKGISTFDNKYKAKYWHLMAGFDACERRGIDKEEFFSHYFNKHGKNISISNSKEYKLGKLILSPIRKIYNQFK